MWLAGGGCCEIREFNTGKTDDFGLLCDSRTESTIHDLHARFLAFTGARSPASDLTDTLGRDFPTGPMWRPRGGGHHCLDPEHARKHADSEKHSRHRARLGVVGVVGDFPSCVNYIGPRRSVRSPCPTSKLGILADAIRRGTVVVGVPGRYAVDAIAGRMVFRSTGT